MFKGLNKELQQQGKYHITKKYLVKKEDILIANGFVKIENIVLIKTTFDDFIEVTEFDMYCYPLYFDGGEDMSDDEKILNFRFVIEWDAIMSKMEFYFKSWAAFKRKINRFYEIEKNEDFKKVLQRYCVRRIEKFQSQNKILDKIIGWVNYTDDIARIKKEFLGVTYDSPSPELESKFRLSEKEDEEYLGSNGIIFLNSYLNDNTKMIILWLYLIMCIEKSDIIKTVYNIYGYEDIEYEFDERPFPCLSLYYKNNIRYAKKTANLIFQFFKINFQKLDYINKIYSINMDSISFFNKDIAFIDNVPILVHSKRGITRSTVKKLIKSEAVKNPVFITSRPLDFDEVIDFDMEQLNVDYSNIEKLQEDRNKLDIILQEFIKWRGRRSEEYILNKLDEDLLLINDIKDITKDWRIEVVNGHFECCFLVSIAIFKIYCQEEYKQGCYKEIVRLMRKKVKEFFEIKDPETSQSIDLKTLFIKYIKNLFNNQSDNRAYVYWNDVEKRGLKEECYYLEYDLYFADFCKFCNKTIPQTDLNNMLRSEELVKLNKDKKSMGMYRAYNGKKIYVLVVLKSAIDKSV